MTRRHQNAVAELLRKPASAWWSASSPLVGSLITGAERSKSRPERSTSVRKCVATRANDSAYGVLSFEVVNRPNSNHRYPHCTLVLPPNILLFEMTALDGHK